MLGGKRRPDLPEPLGAACDSDGVAPGTALALPADSPFHLKLRPGVVPWLARFAASSTPAKARAGTEVLRSLTLASLELHAELARAGLDAAYEQRGTLDVFETEDGFSAGVARARHHGDAGMRAEILEATAARALEPALAGPIAGAVHWVDEAHCDPGRFTAAVGAAAADAGAAIHTDCEVLDVSLEAGRVALARDDAGRARGRRSRARGGRVDACARAPPRRARSGGGRQGLPRRARACALRTRASRSSSRTRG